MAEGDEPDLVEDWIAARLLATASVASAVGTRYFPSTAPDGTTYPFITYAPQDMNDIVGVGTARVMSSTLWLVKAVTQARESTAELRAAVRALDEALTTEVSQTVSGGYIFGSVRESPFRLQETAEGNEYRHQGGLYRIYVKGSS